MKKIAIIGFGFSGTMTAVHLIRNAQCPFELIIIDNPEFRNKGIAYNPNSSKQLLNVVASRMSAFHDLPNHFSDWLCEWNDLEGTERNILENSYLPRFLYGKYLESIWKETTKSAVSKHIRITFKDDNVADMEVSDRRVVMVLGNGEKVTTQYCLIATGNQLPGNPEILNRAFFKSRNYIRNPWDALAIMNNNHKEPLLILGNGLTMVDTVLGLVENGYNNKIITLSPHGFTILPHSANNCQYTAMNEELQDNKSLLEIVKIVHKHLRNGRKTGISPEDVIDSIRPFTHKLWKNLTEHEKRIFMSRIRHRWNAVRHRIPVNTYDRIRQMASTGQLVQHSGKLIDISESKSHLNVLFFENQTQTIFETKASVVINCTGPATDLMKAENSFLKKCLIKGIIAQDDLKLGVMVNPLTFEVTDHLQKPHKNLFAIGSLLKGVLWESTAVKELREQAEAIAMHLNCLMRESLRG